MPMYRNDGTVTKKVKDYLGNAQFVQPGGFVATYDILGSPFTKTADAPSKLGMLEAETIAAGESAVSAAIELRKLRLAGFFSLQVILTGDGTGKLEYLLSNDGVNYFTPSSGADIVAAHTKISGPGADGKDLYSFQPEPTNFLKIKATETVGADPIVVTAVLAIPEVEK